MFPGSFRTFPGRFLEVSSWRHAGADTPAVLHHPRVEHGGPAEGLCPIRRSEHARGPTAPLGPVRSAPSVPAQRAQSSAHGVVGRSARSRPRHSPGRWVGRAKAVPLDGRPPRGNAFPRGVGVPHDVTEHPNPVRHGCPAGASEPHAAWASSVQLCSDRKVALAHRPPATERVLRAI